jgi:hypothetical protein
LFFPSNFLLLLIIIIRHNKKSTFLDNNIRNICIYCFHENDIIELMVWNHIIEKESKLILN